MKRRSFIKTTALGNAGLITFQPILADTWVRGADKKAKKIKIGQVGICHEHAAIITSLRKMYDVFEIVGVVDDRHTMAARFAGDNLKPYEGLKWMSEEELLNTPGLQAVMVETPNTDLVPTALRCIEHNLAIHMDKPGGEDLKLFGKLLQGCKERGLPFQMGYMFRNNPAFQFCQKAVRRGWLGDVYEIPADMSHHYGGETYQRYLSHFKGGIMFNLICHHIDLVVSILGRPEKVTPFLRSTPGAANGAKNNCQAMIEYPHTIVSLSACDLEADGYQRRRFKICGSKGTIELSPHERFDGKPLQMELILLEGNDEYTAGSHIVDFGIKLDRFEDHLLEFAKIIRGEMKNPYTYEHDYLVQEVHLAASGYIKWNN